MLKIWNKTLDKLSGNLTTNEYMPKKLKNILLDEDLSLKNELFFEELKFKPLSGVLNEIKGLNILSSLQNLKQKNCLTIFRAIRFPTYKRIYQMIYEQGYAVANYEQERILELYKNKQYTEKRKKIQKDNNFWTQPQERVVYGLPVFSLVNDALQIHYAFRNKIDKLAIVAIYVPYGLLKNKKVKLIANSAIDLDFNNKERDIEIQDYICKNETVKIDHEPLRARGVDLQEMYAKNLPWNIKNCEKLGIKQDFFILDIYEITNQSKIKKLFKDTDTLTKNKDFLHGFFGDQNIFGRRSSRYLPSRCFKVNKKI